MSMLDSVNLRGHTILILESAISPFAKELQAAIDRTGAESLIARDRVAALERTKYLRFSAAIINAAHGDLKLDIPFLRYGTDAVPAKPATIVAALGKLLAR